MSHIPWLLLEGSLCLDQAYCMQSTNAAKYFSKSIYDNLNIEGKGGKSKSQYELAVLGEIETEEAIFQFDQKNNWPQRMVK